MISDKVYCLKLATCCDTHNICGLKLCKGLEWYAGVIQMQIMQSHQTTPQLAWQPRAGLLQDTSCLSILTGLYVSTR